MKRLTYITTVVLVVLMSSQLFAQPNKKRPTVHDTRADVKALMADLKSNDDQVRAKALYELAKEGTDAPIDDFIAMLNKDPVPGVRIAAVHAIRAVNFWKAGGTIVIRGKPVYAIANAMKNDKDAAVRRAACEAIGAMGSSYGAAALVEVITKDNDDYLREMAARSLLAVVGPECADLTPTLIDFHKKAKEENPQIERGVLVSLARIGAKEDELVPLLLENLKMPRHPASRITSVDALGALGPKAKKAVPLLIEYLKVSLELDRRDPMNMSTGLARTLGRIGPDANNAIPLLRTLSKSPFVSPSTRITAERAIKAISQPENQPTTRFKLI